MKKILPFFTAIFGWLGVLLIQVNITLADGTSFSKGLKTTAEGDNAAGYGAMIISAALTMAKIAGSVLALAPAFVGVMGTLLLIYGGYIWMMSRGNEQEVARAKTIITNTLVAMAVVLLAWAIVKLVMPVWEKVTL